MWWSNAYDGYYLTITSNALHNKSDEGAVHVIFIPNLPREKLGEHARLCNIGKALEFTDGRHYEEWFDEYVGELDLANIFKDLKK